jgi:multiple sugar transport system ATP-binding protein
MVFQNYALYPHMTVLENMAFSLKLKGAPKPEITAKVNRAAEILGLTPLLERYPRQLSGGQRQRVAMGRAIVRDPQVFLFDEPLSNLDAKLRVQMRSEIKALHQRLSTTTVYVTHDQVEAMTMADRIVVMQDGRVEQVGAPLELYDRPANLFVATFIGSPAMNLIEGRITGEGFVTTSGLTLPLASAPAGSVGQPALYGIRPEHFSLGGEGGRGRSGRGEGSRGEGGSGGSIPAEVVVVEPTGSETQVVATLAGQNLTAVFRERVHTRPGETLTLSPDPTKVHLFNKETGHRLN